MVSTLTPAVIAADMFEAFNKHDLDAAFALVTDDFCDDYVVLGRFEGKAKAKEMVQEMIAAFPDFTIKADRIIANDSFATVQWTASGTFTGSPFRGIRATGSKVEVRGCDVMEFEKGLLSHNTIYYDGASFARQVGILPSEDSFVEDLITRSFNMMTFAKGEVRSIADFVR